MPKGIRATTKTTTGRTVEKRGYNRQVGSKPPGRPPKTTATTRLLRETGVATARKKRVTGTIPRQRRVSGERKQRVSGEHIMASNEQIMTEQRWSRGELIEMKGTLNSILGILQAAHPGQRHDIGETQHFRNVG